MNQDIKDHVMVHQYGGSIDKNDSRTWMKCSRCGVIRSPDSGNLYFMRANGTFNAKSVVSNCNEIIVRSILEA